HKTGDYTPAFSFLLVGPSSSFSSKSNRDRPEPNPSLLLGEACSEKGLERLPIIRMKTGRNDLIGLHAFELEQEGAKSTTPRAVSLQLPPRILTRLRKIHAKADLLFIPRNLPRREHD